LFYLASKRPHGFILDNPGEAIDPVEWVMRAPPEIIDLFIAPEPVQNDAPSAKPTGTVDHVINDWRRPRQPSQPGTGGKSRFYEWLRLQSANPPEPGSKAYDELIRQIQTKNRKR
jgi:hypothetical protein